MNIDKTTLQDLAIFHAEEEQSVFNALNFTQTSGGAQWLTHLLNHPFEELKPILETQAILKLMLRHADKWPVSITNGTIMVLEKFYQSQIDRIPPQANALTAITYKILHAPDFSLVRYSVEHAIDFLQGMQQLAGIFEKEELPALLHTILERIRLMLGKGEIPHMLQVGNKKKLSPADQLRFGHYLLYHFKSPLLDLIDLYGRLEAYHSLALAINHYHLQFPEFQVTDEPNFNAAGLRHILLKHPVSYDVRLNLSTNFVFLTGANMAGKSTFIKAVGVAAYLAHIGMAVPAQNMQLSLFHGIISNIQVSDNLAKGESYFYNEVQRIKNTITRINNGKKWLVLIDELFKGTNVQDAMRCSSTVIKGLLKIRNSLFILSTHLYEIGEELKPFPNITFRYFETHVEEDQLHFSYQLKEGISNDRLGYLILKREGVVSMIDNL